MKQELDNIRAAVDQLEGAMLSAATDLRTLKLERDRLLAEKADLEAKIAALQPKPEPVKPAVPDVVIKFGDKILRPEGPGEVWEWSGEQRWFWDVTSDLRIILDAVGKQRRIILQRAWGDLPLTAPVAEVRIGVALDGEKVWDGDVRIHHHTRPCMTFRREPAPAVHLNAWKGQGVLPNFKSQKLDGKIPNRWEWKPWSLQPEAATANPWTERFGIASKSWVGGVPLSNEGSMISPWDATLLLSANPSPELWEMCADTADSVGNYAVHFVSRVTGLPFEHNTEGGTALPQLNADNLPALNTAAGVRLPVADIAHCMSLPNVMALLTGERFYIEALQSMVLLGSLAKKGAERANGIYWSGQVRSVAWWLRNLYHLCQATGGDTSRHLPQLRENLKWMTERFALPSGPDHRPTGILSWVAHKNSPWMRFAASTTGQTTSTGNAHFLAHVLGEVHRSGIIGGEAEKMLRHVLKVARGAWEHSPYKKLASWLQHSGTGSRTETWPEIMKRTFAWGIASVSEFPEPITTDIIAWHRAAVVVGHDLGEAWAIDALPEIDAMLAAERRVPSIAWQVEPASK